MRLGRHIKVGDKFGRLKVVTDGPSIRKYGSNRRTMICECDCGTTGLIIQATDLLSGRKKTCGRCDWNKREPRCLNGYKVIYKPDWPSAMKGSNYRGYVYEHRYVMELKIGRTLQENECVHHRDFNRLNNSAENLILLPKPLHSSLHRMLATKEMSVEEYQNIEDGELIQKVKEYKERVRCCLDCGKELAKYSKGLRCKECSKKHSRRNERPSIEELEVMIRCSSVSDVAKRLGVSFHTIKKWIKGSVAKPVNAPDS